MASPYGLGFGIGQAAAGLGEGINRGLMMGPQIQQARLQNQMGQMGQEHNQMGQEHKMAGIEALQQPVAPISGALSPYDEPIAQIERLEKAAKASGDAQGVSQLLNQRVQLMHKRTSHLLGMGAQTALGGGTDQAMKFLKAAGLGIEGLQRNQDGTFNIKFEGQPEQKVHENFIRGVAADPGQMLQQTLLHDRYAGQAQQKADELEYKKKKAQDYRIIQDRKLDQALSEGQAKRESAEKIAKIGAGARIGQARETQRGAMERFKLAPANQLFGYLTSKEEEGGLGMSPHAAMTQLKSFDQRKAGEAPEMWAYKQAVRTASMGGRGDDEDHIEKLHKAFMNTMPKESGPAPRAAKHAAPTHAPVSSEGVSEAPADVLAGMPKPIQDAYNSGKVVKDKAGKRYQKKG